MYPRQRSGDDALTLSEIVHHGHAENIAIRMVDDVAIVDTQTPRHSFPIVLADQGDGVLAMSAPLNVPIAPERDRLALTWNGQVANAPVIGLDPETQGYSLNYDLGAHDRNWTRIMDGIVKIGDTHDAVWDHLEQYPG